MDPIDRLQAQITELSGSSRKPWVTLSYAQSLDGSLAAHRGAPLQLSGPESLRLTHRLRAAHQAILVGIGTVLADDPRLTVRLVPGDNPQPVILDSHLRIPLKANLLNYRQTGAPPPWIVTTQQENPDKLARLQSMGARLLPLPGETDGRVHLPALLDCLADLGITRVIVEGGARVISSFLSQRLVDFVVLTIAPALVGGLRALEAQPKSGLTAIRPPFPRLLQFDSARLGDDLVVWGNLERIAEPRSSALTEV
ncbi:MAG TPA: RibD family protein [Anaerolineales bacterium]|nr:RibD family protein [Anaerolineales bacterium]